MCILSSWNSIAWGTLEPNPCKIKGIWGFPDDSGEAFSSDFLILNSMVLTEKPETNYKMYFVLP
jgi:hypothetical protein